MELLGLSPAELFTLLFIGMGPIRVSLAFAPIAATAERPVQRAVARRVVLVGFLVALLVIVAGGGVVRNFAPQVDLVLLGGGVVVVTVTLAALARHPAVPPRDVPVADPMNLATTPLTVPVMINPVGVTLLFAVAAYVDDIAETLVFLGLVIGILALNYTMLLVVPRIAQRLTRPILGVVQELFGVLTVALGLRLILEGLAGFGVVTLS